jgi:hypothetical protein
VIIAVVGGLVVALLGWCLLLLVALYRRLASIAAHADAAARERARLRRRGRKALAATIVRELRAVGRDLVGELRREAAERRETVQRLMRDATLAANDPIESEPPVPFPRSEPPTFRPSGWSRPAPVLASSARRLPPDSPTPANGVPVGAFRSEPEGDAR